MDEEAAAVFLHVRRILTAWVGFWFDVPTSDWLVGQALVQTYMEALQQFRTAHGPYERVFHHLEKLMRRHERYTGTIVPLGLHRMFPKPSLNTLRGFSGLYSKTAHIIEVTRLSWAETLDMATFVMWAGAEGVAEHMDPEAFKVYTNGHHCAIWAADLMSGHSHETVECDRAESLLLHQYSKTQKWYHHYQPTPGKEVNNGSTGEDNYPGFSGPLLAAD